MDLGGPHAPLARQARRQCYWSDQRSDFRQAGRFHILLAEQDLTSVSDIYLPVEGGRGKNLDQLQEELNAHKKTSLECYFWVGPIDASVKRVVSRFTIVIRTGDCSHRLNSVALRGRHCLPDHFVTEY